VDELCGMTTGVTRDIQDFCLGQNAGLCVHCGIPVCTVVRLSNGGDR
jgi:hypothetical protein